MIHSRSTFPTNRMKSSLSQGRRGWKGGYHKKAANRINNIAEASPTYLRFFFDSNETLCWLRNKAFLITNNRHDAEDPDGPKTNYSKTANRREAERFAMKLEESLNCPQKTIRQLHWKEFRSEYCESAYPAQKSKTRETTTTTFNAVEAILAPSQVASIDAAAIRLFTRMIRQRTKSEFSVARHLRELRKILNWAVDNELLASSPKIRIPEAKGRKGRDVTGEEFERILSAVTKLRS